MNKRNLKALAGTCLIVPWVVYQLWPVLRPLRIDTLGAIFTAIAIVGVIMISTIEREKAVFKERTRKLKMPRVR